MSKEDGQCSFCLMWKEEKKGLDATKHMIDTSSIDEYLKNITPEEAKKGKLEYLYPYHSKPLSLQCSLYSDYRAHCLFNCNLKPLDEYRFREYLHDKGILPFHFTKCPVHKITP